MKSLGEWCLVCVVLAAAIATSAAGCGGGKGDTDFAFGRAATIQTIAGALCSTECGL